jgi:serine/threonine-protein kinase HipA
MTQRQIKLLLGNRPGAIGTLYFDATPGRYQSSFEYSTKWLRSADRFALDPALPLTPIRQYHTQLRRGSPFPGVFSDSGPDGWAMIVLARYARLQGAKFLLSEMTPLDLLLTAADEFRIGAIRYQDEHDEILGGGVDHSTDTTVLQLNDLLNASEAVERNQETAEQIFQLLGEGTSLGGLRPKASICLGEGRLAIAKFPSIKDTRPFPRGEALALELARQTRITVPKFSIVDVLGRPVFLVDRFDRMKGGGRKHYVSAITMLQSPGQTGGSYVAIAERIRKIGSAPRADLNELFRRIVFNVLISNSDDHLGNHGFLYNGGGKWRLSPAFDINPFPETPRVLKTAISRKTGPVASIEACLSEARAFDLKQDEATNIVAEVGTTVSRWRQVALSPVIGMTDREVDLFAAAFEHSELNIARQ